MSNTETIRKRYNRVAKCYDLFEKPMESTMFSKWRAEIMKHVTGKVLEVGVGTGKNIKYYPEDIDLVAIDFSRNMLDKAREKYKETNRNINFLEMDAQDMSFEDNTFDSVLTSCVFCSVPDPVKGLKEIRRVCKPGGKVVMLEHVRSSKKVLGWLMDLFNPIPLHLYGANINRNTVENLKKAGFTSIEVKDLWLDVVKLIIIKNEK